MPPEAGLRKRLCSGGRSCPKGHASFPESQFQRIAAVARIGNQFQELLA